MRAILIGAVGVLLVTLLSAQAPPDQLTFEVATVKLHDPGDRGQSIRLLPSGQLNVTGITARSMIGTGWGTETIQTARQIVGGPAWLDTDRYDIVAKAAVEPGGTAFSDPKRVITMLRSLLEERFQVKFHTEQRDTPIYALALSGKDAKFGALFKPTMADCYTRESPPPQNAPPDPARLCGIRGGNGNVTYVSVTMQEIARSLAGYPVVGRPVMDRTGLKGKYDLHMEFVPAFVDSPTGDGSQVANPAADSGPNLFTALVEQAGLKLQGERGSVDFIVIDRVERPSAD